jgi:hypothetical protein
MSHPLPVNPPETTPPMSPLSRLVGVFISPGETFAYIARKPDILFPLIVAIVGSAAVVETLLWKIGAEQLVRNSLITSGRAASMSAEQLEQVVHRGATITAIIMHISAVLGAPAFLLIMAGIGLLFLNPILGAQVSFKGAFSTTCYASLVRLVGVVMAIPLIFMGDAEHLNPENPIPTNPGFFLDPSTTSKGVYSLAASLDVLTLWFLIVLAIGLSRLTGGKTKTTTVFFMFFGLWMVWVLGRAAIAAIF